MKVLIKGAGDLASGIACRLHHCGMDVVMTEIGIPTTVRRTVAFSPAIYEGKAEVEGIEGVRQPGRNGDRSGRAKNPGFGGSGVSTGYGVETGCGGGCYYCKEKSGDDNP